MLDTAPKAEMLRSLGRLVRGLSAIFWGLPLALLTCVETAETQTLHDFNILPPLVFTGLIAYGLWQLGSFQKSERIWVAALDRAKVIALVNVGLSPFLYWLNQRPQQPFFMVMIQLLGVFGLLFLSSLNLVLYRLSAMLPDESLRQETRHFTVLNRFIVLGILLLGIIIFSMLRFWPQVITRIYIEQILGSGGLWLLMFLALLPLAMTMALVWKIKEVILDSVFSAGS